MSRGGRSRPESSWNQATPTPGDAASRIPPFPHLEMSLPVCFPHNVIMLRSPSPQLVPPKTRNSHNTQPPSLQAPTPEPYEERVSMIR
eukprot:gene25928-biopygen11873